MALSSETETVVKRLVPYLTRRGYDLEKDLFFEVAAVKASTGAKGFIDIEVRAGGKSPKFLIEAKRLSKTISTKDINQALDYAESRNVPFVVVTNGEVFRCYNANNRSLIEWNGSAEKVPSKHDLAKVLSALKSNSNQSSFNLADDESLPYRPGLPLKQLNRLFFRCHSTIRSIEKNEETAFEDFSKLLFLKLIEEKHSSGELDRDLPYSYRFYKLARTDEKNADQVRDSILSMLNSIKTDKTFGNVIPDDIRLRNPKTFLRIVRELAAVSFQDSGVDSKGAAFEYFVRATLKGKKLGQYFTPRPLVKLMFALIGTDKIYNSVRALQPIRVIDPACGTGGFLVYGMLFNIEKARLARKDNKITAELLKKIEEELRVRVFFGSDANEAVASSAKMNMIVAGDGHSNIRHEDSLAMSAQVWGTSTNKAQIVVTNPPFGTSELASLDEEERGRYAISATKGQNLFLQKMIAEATDGADICTVIDEGILNNDSSTTLRRHILQNCFVRAVVSLPETTFKPNKINVISSVILLEKRIDADIDLSADYQIPFFKLKSLGYDGSGERERGWDEESFLKSIEESLTTSNFNATELFEKFDVSSKLLVAQSSHRLDLRYWNPLVRVKLSKMTSERFQPLSSLCKVSPHRGKSPSAAYYVDSAEGFAAVVKAGSSISKYGTLLESEDYIEKDTYEDQKRGKLERGDVLLSSTGTGTLGKACVYDSDAPAVADSHITIIRVDTTKIDPYFLADYLRVGFGADQISRVFTGSTGLIELTEDAVRSIVVDVRGSIDEQRESSNELRKAEQAFVSSNALSSKDLQSSRRKFADVPE